MDEHTFSFDIDERPEMDASYPDFIFGSKDSMFLKVRDTVFYGETRTREVSYTRINLLPDGRPTERRYIIFHPIGDSEIRDLIVKLLEENGGEFPLTDLEGLLKETFGKSDRTVISECDLEEDIGKLRYSIYRLSNGRVSSFDR